VVPDTPAAASLNRTRIVDVPGIDVDEAVRGRQAYHLLSAPALIRYAQQRADVLQLPAGYRDVDPSAPEVRQALPRYVDACLRAASPDVREAAEAIARRLGRNLGHLAVTLYRGDAVNREAREDWPEAAWERWRAIHTYRLGGGVMSGELGDRLIYYAGEFLAEVGYDGVLSVAKTPRPRNMGLLGVGRTIPSAARETYRRALCLDLGQTSIKRAVVHYEDGVLMGLQWLPPVPVRWQWRNRPDAGAGIDPQAVLTFTARAVAEGLEMAHAEASAQSDEVGMSIAAYVRGGKLLGNGLYARMQVLSEDAAGLIADAVTREGAPSIRPIIVHDGTAAALLHAGEAATVVLVIGTAIGVGFPPASTSGLCPIAPHVQQGDHAP
jgi:hypothetical protein